MKNFKLKKGEELKKIQKDIEVEANENQFILTLFLTTRRSTGIRIKTFCSGLCARSEIRMRGQLELNWSPRCNE